MRIKSTIFALALGTLGSLGLSSPLCAQTSTSTKTILRKNTTYKEAMTAMADHLPSIASQKLIQLLKTNEKKLSKKQKIKLLFLLAESQIRALKPTEALITLKKPLISDHPDAIFWKGQVLATAGRYSDAIKMLALAKPTSKHFKLAQNKIAYLSAALGDINTALNILRRLIKNTKNKASIAPLTYLSLSNLYLAKKDPLNAKKVLAKINSKDQTIIIAKQTTQAHIYLQTKEYSKVISTITKLLKSSDPVDLKTLSYSTSYLADAYHLADNKQQAINTLIKFIDNNSNTPLLGSMFTKLGSWIPKKTPITDSMVQKLITWANRDKSEENTNNQVVEPDKALQNRSAFAHYYYARYLAAQNNTISKAKAISEFSLLRTRYPSHILAGTSLTDTATTQLALEKIEPAKKTLQLLQQVLTPINPIAKQQASFLLGKLNLNEKNYAKAATAFQQIVDSTHEESQLRTAAIVNAAGAYLSAADTNGFKTLSKKIKHSETQNNLLLEYALWLTKQNKIEARSILQEFIHENPKHPRILESKIALAKHCLQISPLNINLSQSIISEINKNNFPKNQHANYSYLLYRNATAHSDYAGAATIAGQFIAAHPTHPRKIEFTLLQGQALYHNGQHNAARRMLLSLAKTNPNHSMKGYAEYYAAMSAKLEGTPQSEDEAILLFTKIAKSKSSLSSEALLQLSKLYIRKNLPQRAIDALQPVFDSETKNNKSTQLGIQLALAHHAVGNTKPNHLEKAIQIFNILIKQHPHSNLLNQIKYNKALTLQHMDKDEEALAIYYSVINVNTELSPLTEWRYYYKCGFTAITLLEEMKNPKGAIAIAKKLALSGGNRAEEASKQIRDLEKEHMIWQQ